MRLLADIWGLLDRRQRRSLVLFQCLSLLMAVSTLAAVAAVAPFFSVLGDPTVISRSRALAALGRLVGAGGERDLLVVLGLLFLGFVLLANAINILGSLAMNRFAYRIGDYFCVALFEEYIHRGQQFHLSGNSATLFSNIVWEVNRGTTGALQSYFLLSTNVATSLLIMVATFLLNPLIACGAVAALAGSYGLIYLMARSRLLRNGALESEHTEARTLIVNETLGAIKEILLLQVQGFFRGKFERSCQSISRIAVQTQAIAQSPRYVLECIVVAGLVAAALLISRREPGSAWLAQLSFLGFAAYRLLPALQQIFNSVVKIRGDSAAFERIAADLRSATRDRTRPAGRRPEPRDPAWQGRPRRDIQLQQVSFGYGADRPFMIRAATMRVPAGATVGLLGPSGAGKTTLVELMIGLLVPSSGRVAVDGVVVDDSNRADWQAQIAYVPQQVFLFDASLAENIALATAGEQIDLERVAAAARLAQLDSLVGTLPKGYSQTVGERGTRLSGGQRQRVGIARALYRSASVLILDEATNSLDGLTESEILATLEALRGERTIILIAHRVSTAQRLDLVFEVNNGTVVCTGSSVEIARQAGATRSVV
jgi:ABC-type multidrug transport system fused ATPase/permease subunit